MLSAFIPLLLGSLWHVRVILGLKAEKLKLKQCNYMRIVCNFCKQMKSSGVLYISSSCSISLVQEDEILFFVWGRLP